MILDKMVMKAFFLTPGVIFTGILILSGFVSIIIGKRIGYHQPRSSLIITSTSWSTSCFIMGFLFGPIDWLVLLFSWHTQLHIKRFQSLILALDNQDNRKDFNQKDIKHFMRLLSFYIKIFKCRNILIWLVGVSFLICIFYSRLGSFGFLPALLLLLIASFLLSRCAMWLSTITSRSERDFIYGKESCYEYFMSRRSNELLNSAVELLHKLQEKRVYFN